jgi:hypothetical protein
MKNTKLFIAGTIVGLLTVFLIAAARPEGAVYQATLCDVRDSCIYTVLNTKTGETQVFQLNPGSGHLIMQKASLDISGKGDWSSP